MACFTKIHSKVCGNCPNAIVPGNTYLLFQEKNFHLDCFLCDTCNKKIAGDGKEFYMDETKKKYCEPCVKKYINLLKSQSKKDSTTKWTAIIYISIDSMPSCFECKRQFSNNESFYKGTNDSPYCVECYTKLNSKMCTGCSKMIAPSETTISINDNNYHKDCLKCTKCSKVLGANDQIFCNEKSEFMCEKCIS